MKTIFLTLTLIIMATIAFYNAWLLIAVAVGILNALLNHIRIKDHIISKLWHGLQFGLLVAVLAALVWRHIVMWDEVLIIVAFYYTSFEVALNLFRKKPWNYVGHTAFMDRTIRNMFNSEAFVTAFFVASKYVLMFAGLTVFLLNKPI